MPLGPRVGGAHVEVNMQFDEKSLAAVGKQIHRQLASISDHNRSVYQSIGRESVTAWRAALGATLAAAPLMGSAISGMAGAATLLAGAVNSVATASGTLLPIFTSMGIAGLTLGIGMRGFSAAVSETNPKALQEMLADMPKSMQNAVLSTRKLSNEMRAAIWPKLFAGLSDGINKLRETGVVQRGLGLMADQLNGLAKSVLNYANSGQGVKVLDKFFKNNAKVFGALSKAVVPFLDGFLRLVNALTPAALRLADRITDIGKRFQSWTKADGFGKRIDESMKKAEKTAGLLFKVLGNLGSAISNVFGITNPATNSFLEMLVAVTQRFEDFTDSASGKSSIAEWAMNSVEVMRQFGRTIESVFKVVAELADSRVIIGFLETVQMAFEHIGNLPLDKMVDGFVKIAQAIQPVSAAFLALIIGGATLNIFLGSLMGQFGGVVASMTRFKNFGKDLFGGFKGGGAAADDVGKFSTALKGVGAILIKAFRFVGIAGFVVWIGTLIAKSDKLKAKLGEVWEAFKGLWEPLKTAFSEIKTSLTPVGNALEPVFNLLDKIGTLAIGIVLDTIIYGFKSLGKVIKGTGRIISGVIDFFVGLFTLDGSKMLGGLKKLASGIIPLLEGAFGLFITLFAPAKLLKIGGRALGGLLGGFKGAGPGIVGFFKRLLDDILLRLMYLGPNLLRLGGEALKGLGRGIAKFIPFILKTVGRLYIEVVKFWLKLPGRLTTLGGQAIGALGRAIGSGAGFLKKKAGEVVETLFTKIKELPGKLKGLAKFMLEAGKALMKGFFDGLLAAAKGTGSFLVKVGDAVVGAIIGAINHVIGFINDALPDKIKIPLAPDIDLPNNPIPTIPGYARGTSNYPGGIGLVGERGPELVNLPRGSQISTASETRDLLGGTGGGDIIIQSMMPHDYNEFRRQLLAEKRKSAIGGRRVVRAT